jgi:hypothetical protein
LFLLCPVTDDFPPVPCAAKKAANLRKLRKILTLGRRRNRRKLAFHPVFPAITGGEGPADRFDETASTTRKSARTVPGSQRPQCLDTNQELRAISLSASLPVRFGWAMRLIRAGGRFCRAPLRWPGMAGLSAPHWQRLPRRGAGSRVPAARLAAPLRRRRVRPAQLRAVP